MVMLEELSEMFNIYPTINFEEVRVCVNGIH